jgi:LPXTG-motif cell wall-anchored protein
VFNKLTLKNIGSPSLKTYLAILALSASLVYAFASADTAASPAPVDLGSASSFAVLAGSGITNTGTTNISGTAGGDMGSHPTQAFTESEANPVITTGTKYKEAEEIVAVAKSALEAAYLDAAGRSPETTIATELGGATLTPAVYSTAAGTMGLTGILTLDGEGDPDAVFIFKMASTLITASASKIVFINEAQACNVFWQVGSSATFATNSIFAGHVLALTSITANTGATFEGQLLARNGAVTLDSNTIVNDLCVETVTETATSSPAPDPAPETTTTSPTSTTSPETATASPAPAPATEAEAVGPVPAPKNTEEAKALAPVTETETGGTLPRTDNSWILTFIVGIALLALGSSYLVLRRRRI